MTSTPLEAARLLLGPVLALVALSYATALSILVTRLQDALAGRGLRFYEVYVGGGSPAVERTTRQLANLFEFPVLFFSAAGFAIACGVNDGMLCWLAWSYAGLRWAHAVIHLTPMLNRLWLRTPVFMVSNFVLLGVWGRLAWWLSA